MARPKRIDRINEFDKGLDLTIHNPQESSDSIAPVLARNRLNLLNPKKAPSAGAKNTILDETTNVENLELGPLDIMRLESKAPSGPIYCIGDVVTIRNKKCRILNIMHDKSRSRGLFEVLETNKRFYDYLKGIK